MRLLRRVTTIVLIPLLIQLMLVGNGFACEAFDHGRIDHAGIVGADTDRSAHAAMETEHGRSSPTVLDALQAAPNDGCPTIPSTPDECSMPACAATLPPTTAAPAADARTVSTERWPDPMTAPPGPAAAPELPPPRA